MVRVRGNQTLDPAMAESRVPWQLFSLFGQGLETSHTKEKTQAKTGLSLWCRLSGIFLTASPDNVDNYKLSNLVQQFNLSGDLI